jgi:hypothetical protein
MDNIPAPGVAASLPKLSSTPVGCLLAAKSILLANDRTCHKYPMRTRRRVPTDIIKQFQLSCQPDAVLRDKFAWRGPAQVEFYWKVPVGFSLHLFDRETRVF